jgi:hypothetical protein
MRLRTWALSTSNEGARSPVNFQFLDGLLRRGCLAATPGVTISADQTEELGVPCVRLHFHLPQEIQSNATTSIPVLIPIAFVGTDKVQATPIFYALVEEVIGWLACVGPKHSLVRLYVKNHGQQLSRSYSSSWQHLHSAFTLFISSLRHSETLFPDLGQFSGTFGVIEVAQARTSSDGISSGFIMNLTLSSREQMSLFLPRAVANLPRDIMLDWVEVQNEFSTRLL